MSNIALSDIQEIIERTIFHRIRMECVDKGYLPNILDLFKYQDSDYGYKNWETDLKTIKDSPKKFAIEVFNNSAPDDKNMKRLPRIVVLSDGFLPGALGGDSSRQYVLDNEKYYAQILPPQSADFYFSINLVADNVEQLRTMNAILSLVLPRRGYIPIYQYAAHTYDEGSLHDNNEEDGLTYESPFYLMESTNNLFVRNIAFANIRDRKESVLERVYRYEIPDIFETLENIVATDIAPLHEIRVEPRLVETLTDVTGEDLDPIVVQVPGD